MNPKSLAYGIAAGAAGTAVLNATTYADMAIRARPASKVPRRVGLPAGPACGDCRRRERRG